MSPILFYYQENRQPESYAVHANGTISRPALNMGPFARWRFLGLSNSIGQRQFGFAQIVAELVQGETLPLTTKAGKPRLHVMDLDCGTQRQHGAAVDRLWLARDRPADAIALAMATESAWREEAARKAQEREAARLAASPAVKLAARLAAAADDPAAVREIAAEIRESA